jgi:hypothetical protein
MIIYRGYHNALMKNTEALIDATKAVIVEANIEKNTYLVMSFYHNSR